MRTLAASLAALVVALGLAACGSDEDGAAPSPGDTAPPPATETSPAETSEPPAEPPLELLLYFTRGEHLGVGSVLVEPTPRVGTAALEALLAGPDEVERAAGLGTVIPEGTRLLGLVVEDGVATVDLSREFESGGGSLSMLLRVASVVYTLTQFPTVEEVRFELDGRPVEAIGGEGIVVDPPVGRADFEGQTPPILVERPVPGSEVGRVLRILGTANTFEATFQAEVLDGRGQLLAQRFVTATSGSGTRGTFDATLELAPHDPGPGELVVYELSAKDGSRINEVRIPIVLAP
jgi:hypothetical protein